MNRKTLLMIAAVAGALALAGCMVKTAAAPGPLDAQAIEIAKARYADTTPEELEKGRQLFLKSCSECHGYPDLVAYPEQKWPGLARGMSKKAGLKADEGELVTRFVMVAREAAVRPAAKPTAPAAETTAPTAESTVSP